MSSDGMLDIITDMLTNGSLPPSKILKVIAKMMIESGRQPIKGVRFNQTLRYFDADVKFKPIDFVA